MSFDAASRETTISLRMTREEREQVDQAAAMLGFSSVSEYMRHLHKRFADSRISKPPTPHEPTMLPSTVFQTDLGKIVHGDSRDYLSSLEPGSVDLFMTSPPFGLVRRKSYGNEDADAYCEWFRPFAEGMHRALKEDGSIVIDIGGAWKPGIPTRSLYHFKLLLMLCEEYGFHLAQEHFWWNPAKLPSPAEWVNVRRVRVKDAVNCVWWLSKTPYPKANNRRVLAPYSTSMKSLLKNGYSPKMRPSGHDISANFSRDNGGAVPPNLLAIANTESNGAYQEYCRRNNIPVHPARFPSQLPEYFIRFLTDPGDLVVDPFAGSCITGAVSESLGRNWNCVELDSEFIRGALGRFTDGSAIDGARSPSASYSIASPVSVPVDEREVPLIANGGATR